MKCKFLEDHCSVSDDGFQSHGIYCSPIARIPIVAFQTLCSSFCVLSSDPFSTAVGASLSMVQWAGLGTPSHQSHQITSSYLEVSPQSGKRWVSQTFYSIRAKREKDSKPSWVPVLFLLRWCLAVLCEQKWMEAFQTQPHAETKVSLT